MKVCPACGSGFTSTEWACPACAWRARSHGDIRFITTADGAPGFAPEFFPALASVEDHHFWFHARNALIAWALRKYAPGARSFLEVGCGTGQVSRFLRRARPDLRITASDIFLEGLTIATGRLPGVELVKADARSLPWQDEFDVVGAFDVLEHVSEDADVMGQLARAIVPGGAVIITVPQHAWLQSPVDDYSGHVRRYSRGELAQILRKAGLRVERLTSFVSVLMPALLVSRALGSRKPVDPMREFRLPPLVNAIGATACAIDRACIRAGVSLPIGGSLLAVARR